VFKTIITNVRTIIRNIITILITTQFRKNKMMKHFEKCMFLSTKEPFYFFKNKVEIDILK